MFDIDAIAYDVAPATSWEQIRVELLRMAGSLVIIDVYTEGSAVIYSLPCQLTDPELTCDEAGEILRFDLDYDATLAIAEGEVGHSETTVGYVGVELGGLRLSITRWCPRQASNPGAPRLICGMT